MLNSLLMDLEKGWSNSFSVLWRRMKSQTRVLYYLICMHCGEEEGTHLHLKPNERTFKRAPGKSECVLWFEDLGLVLFVGACLGKSKSKKLYLEVPQGSRDSASWSELLLPQFGENRNDCVHLMGHLKIPQKVAKHAPS